MILAVAPDRARPRVSIRSIDWSALVFAIERTGLSQRQIAEQCGYESHTSVNALKNIPGTEPKFHQGALILGLWMEVTGLTSEQVPRE